MANRDNTLILHRDDSDSLDFAIWWLLPQLRDLISQDREPDESSLLLRNLLLRILNVTPCITLVLQEFYIDRVYRDCYYHHFASKHFEHSRYCSRVFLFDGNQFESVNNWDSSTLQRNFIGCIVIKPLQCGAIGRTLLSPKYLFEPTIAQQIFVRTLRYNVLFHGINLYVNAFPYTMQDGETLTCAQVTVLNIMDYYSNGYADYRFALPSDIYKISQENSYERTLPSHGMSYSLITKVLSEFGFYPRLYLAESNNISDFDMKRILHYYVESAIPVAIGLRKGARDVHSILCIGHGIQDEQKMLSSLYSLSPTDSGFEKDGANQDRFYIADTANSCMDYIVMDDNQIPYSSYSFEIHGSNLFHTDSYSFNNAYITCLAVPLYKRMFLEAREAFAISTEIITESHFELADAYRTTFGDQDSFINIGSKDNPLIVRLYLASSRSFRSFRINEFGKEDGINLIYLTTPFPRFIWVCELYDIKHYREKKVIGEIIIDATSSVAAMLNSIILVTLPRRIAARGFSMKSNHEKWNNEVQAANMKDVSDAAFIFFPLDDWKPVPSYQSNLHLVSNFHNE